MNAMLMTHLSAFIFQNEKRNDDEEVAAAMASSTTTTAAMLTLSLEGTISSFSALDGDSCL